MVNVRFLYLFIFHLFVSNFNTTRHFAKILIFLYHKINSFRQFFNLSDVIWIIKSLYRLTIAVFRHCTNIAAS